MLLDQIFTIHCFCDTTVNVFISTQESQPSPLHYDYHDLVNIQLLGEKNWQIFSVANDVTYPLTGYKITENTAKKSIFNGRVKVGTLFTIPKGSAHIVSTASDISIHIAIGLRYKSVADLILRLLSHKLADYKEPILSILDKLPQEIDIIKLLDLSLSEINDDNLINQVLSLQRLLPLSSIKESEKINRLIFDRGVFCFQKKGDFLNIKLPLILNRTVTIEENIFNAGLLRIPIELENIIKGIFEYGEINRDSILKEFDDESASEIMNILYKTGLASNSTSRD